MSSSAPPIILGSRSPRRLELLRTLVPSERIRVLAPSSADEAGFVGLTTWPEIEDRLRAVARAKWDDVAAQIRSGAAPADSLILAADTVIVAADESARLAVLGQPPDAPGWQRVVREWFERYYLGRTHAAASAVRLGTADGPCEERVVTTRVTFAADAAPLLDWYLRTGEPRGKAGGYALQGAGSIFVERVDGSPSNVVGLPLRETHDLLERAGASNPRPSGD